MNEDRVVSSSSTLEDEDKRDVEGQENVQVKPGVFNTREKKLTLFCISLYWFIICCAYAMIAPFFPGEVSTVLWKIFVHLHRKLQKVYPGADLAGKISGGHGPGDKGEHRGSGGGGSTGFSCSPSRSIMFIPCTSFSFAGIFSKQYIRNSKFCTLLDKWGPAKGPRKFLGAVPPNLP